MLTETMDSLSQNSPDLVTPEIRERFDKSGIGGKRAITSQMLTQLNVQGKQNQITQEHLNRLSEIAAGHPPKEAFTPKSFMLPDPNDPTKQIGPFFMASPSSVQQVKGDETNEVSPEPVVKEKNGVKFYLSKDGWKPVTENPFANLIQNAGSPKEGEAASPDAAAIPAKAPAGVDLGGGVTIGSPPANAAPLSPGSIDLGSGVTIMPSAEPATPPEIKSKAELDQLPEGKEFIFNGKRFTKNKKGK